MVCTNIIILITSGEILTLLWRIIYPLVNLATPPVSTREVAKVAFGIDFTNKPEGINPAYWDMHSKYASVYGGEGEYLYTKEQELDDIKKFVARSR